MNKLNALFEKFLDIINWYKITNIFSNWIFPAHDLQNLLIHRHDRIKIPQVKPWKYTDMTYFMLCANMEMIVKFIEQEKPEKYVLWYKDEKGQDVGHKYGECGIPILYPELKDKWIMDIIKEIYNWWKKDYIELNKEHDYLLEFWCDYLLGKMKFKPCSDSNNTDAEEIIFDKSTTVKSLEELKKIPNIDWNILTKYIVDSNKILDENYVHEIINNLETKIHDKEQYYLHLCIEVRPYMWT